MYYGKFIRFLKFVIEMVIKINKKQRTEFPHEGPIHISELASVVEFTPNFAQKEYMAVEFKSIQLHLKKTT